MVRKTIFVRWAEEAETKRWCELSSHNPVVSTRTGLHDVITALFKKCIPPLSARQKTGAIVTSAAKLRQRKKVGIGPSPTKRMPDSAEEGPYAPIWLSDRGPVDDL